MERFQYVIDAGERERESYATQQLMRNVLLRDSIFLQLGLPMQSWFVLGFDTQWTGHKPGDIDIIGGPLSWIQTRDFTEALREYRYTCPGFAEQFAAMRVAEA